MMLLLIMLLLTLLLLFLLIRIGRQGLETAADAARILTDLVAQLRIAEQAADAAADQPAQWRTDQAAEKSLGRQWLRELLRQLRW